MSKFNNAIHIDPKLTYTSSFCSEPDPLRRKRSRVSARNCGSTRALPRYLKPKDHPEHDDKNETGGLPSNNSFTVKIQQESPNISKGL